jgi:hypothetical protein
VPSVRRRTGTDSVVARPRFGADDRAIPWDEAGFGSRAERWDQAKGNGIEQTSRLRIGPRRLPTLVTAFEESEIFVRSWEVEVVSTLKFRWIAYVYHPRWEDERQAARRDKNCEDENRGHLWRY